LIDEVVDSSLNSAVRDVVDFAAAVGDDWNNLIGDYGVNQGDNFGSSVAVVAAVDKLENEDVVVEHKIVAAVVVVGETVLSFAEMREVPKEKRFVTILDDVPDSSNHLI
jgi:hypothetical protein